MTIIELLNATVWATIAPSKIHGIGVFAIRDIPKGTRITDRSIHNINETHLCKISPEEFMQIHPAIRNLILDRTTFPEWQRKFYFYSPNDDVCLQSFMNHSDTPTYENNETLRDIKKGEEITEDYRKLVENGKIHQISLDHYSFL